MSLAASIIRAKVATEVRDPADAGMISLAAGLVHDDFAAAEGDDLAAVDSAIAAARSKFSTLFRAPEPARSRHDTTTAAGRQAAALDVKLDSIVAGLNPYSATSLNKTAQAVLEKHRPNTAQKMRVEANSESL